MNSLDREYLAWLYSKIDNRKNRNPKWQYSILAEQLYTKEFVWFVPNDDNRNADGIELRKIFLEETGIEYPGHQWMYMSSSILELLLGLANRLSFLDQRPASVWFWEMITNLGLLHANDAEYDINIELEVDKILDVFIWRLYNPDGSGGLFPLEHPTKDQTKVELWYQMSAYVMEKMHDVWAP